MAHGACQSALILVHAWTRCTLMQEVPVTGARFIPELHPLLRGVDECCYPRVQTDALCALQHATPPSLIALRIVSSVSHLHGFAVVVRMIVPRKSCPAS